MVPLFTFVWFVWFVVQILWPGVAAHGMGMHDGNLWAATAASRQTQNFEPRTTLTARTSGLCLCSREAPSFDQGVRFARNVVPLFTFVWFVVQILWPGVAAHGMGMHDGNLWAAIAASRQTKNFEPRTTLTARTLGLCLCSREAPSFDQGVRFARDGVPLFTFVWLASPNSGLTSSALVSCGSWFKSFLQSPSGPRLAGGQKTSRVNYIRKPARMW